MSSEWMGWGREEGWVRSGRVRRRWEECEEKLKGVLKVIKGTIYKPYFTHPVPAIPNTIQHDYTLIP